MLCGLLDARTIGYAQAGENIIVRDNRTHTSDTPARIQNNIVMFERVCDAELSAEKLGEESSSSHRSLRPAALAGRRQDEREEAGKLSIIHNSSIALLFFHLPKGFSE